MEEKLGEAFNAGDFDVRDKRGLSEVRIGKEDFAKAGLAGGFDDVDNAADGFREAVKREFSDEEFTFEVVLEELIGDGEDGESDRKVEM